MVAHAHADYMNRCIALSMDILILKPFNPQDLSQTLKVGWPPKKSARLHQILLWLKITKIQAAGDFGG